MAQAVAPVATTQRQDEIINGLPEDQQKELYFHSAYPAATLAIMPDDARPQYAREEAVMINEALPAITGASQRQIDFATAVRRRVLVSEIQRVKQLLQRERRAGRLDAALTRAGASDISQLIVTALRRHPRLGVLFSETSARTILDTFT